MHKVGNRMRLGNSSLKYLNRYFIYANFAEILRKSLNGLNNIWRAFKLKFGQLLTLAVTRNNKMWDSVLQVFTFRLHNWCGNFEYSTQNIQYPRSVAEVQQTVNGVRKCQVLRVLGTRHSSSKIADSPNTILSMLGMNRILGLNTSVPSITVYLFASIKKLCDLHCGETLFFTF